MPQLPATDTMLAPIEAESVETCPACGREPDALVGATLPFPGDATAGACVTLAHPGQHFDAAVHPEYRPDIVLVHHENADTEDRE